MVSPKKKTACSVSLSAKSSEVLPHFSFDILDSFEHYVFLTLQPKVPSPSTHGIWAYRKKRCPIDYFQRNEKYLKNSKD
jgi:hypothetical protein